MERIGSEYSLYVLNHHETKVSEEKLSIVNVLFSVFSPWLKWGKGCIAGGFVRACLEPARDDRDEGSHEYSDIDVFFFDRQSFREAKRMLRTRARRKYHGHDETGYDIHHSHGFLSHLVTVSPNNTASSILAYGRSSPARVSCALMKGLGQIYSLRPEKWTFNIRGRSARMKFDAMEYTINLILWDDGGGDECSKRRCIPLLDSFDFNVCRHAFVHDRLNTCLITNARGIWDIATRQLTCNEDGWPGFPSRTGRARILAPGRIRHRLDMYVAMYGYKLDEVSLVAYLNNLVRLASKGKVKARRLKKKEFAEQLVQIRRQVYNGSYDNSNPF